MAKQEKIKIKAIAAVVKFAREAKVGFTLMVHDKRGMITYGTHHLKNLLETSPELDMLSAARMDSVELANGQQTLPDGTDHEVYNSVSSLMPMTKPPCNPSKMWVRECADFLNAIIIRDAKQKDPTITSASVKWTNEKYKPDWWPQDLWAWETIQYGFTKNIQGKLPSLREAVRRACDHHNIIGYDADWTQEMEDRRGRNVVQKSPPRLQNVSLDEGDAIPDGVELEDVDEALGGLDHADTHRRIGADSVDNSMEAGAASASADLDETILVPSRQEYTEPNLEKPGPQRNSTFIPEISRNSSTSSTSSTVTGSAPHVRGFQRIFHEPIDEVHTQGSPPSQTEDQVHNEEEPTQNFRKKRLQRNAKPANDRNVRSSTRQKSTRGKPQRILVIPDNLVEEFQVQSIENTKKALETGALIAGKEEDGKIVISHLIFPHQTGYPDRYEVDDTQLLVVDTFLRESGLFIAGSIHSHPRFDAYLSSVDMHTALGQQLMVPEAFQVVVSGLPTDIRKHPEPERFLHLYETGIRGLKRCKEPSYRFHEHSNRRWWGDVDGDKYEISPDLSIETVDFRE